ncbi:PIN domain-containing protein [Devosia sp.]|uniref:PIN domain-containing protein n=1 Tax=Devosia sp. TaxID=1871048 RepID=UPI003262D0B7
MIGVDTNVLLRLFLDDDKDQHRVAKAFFAARTRDDAAYVSVVTAVEFVWVLKRVYRRTQAEALSLLQLVLSSEDAVLEAGDRIRRALEIALETGADFADVLIAGSAEFAGCEKTLTFDKVAAQRVPGMEVLG